MQLDLPNPAPPTQWPWVIATLAGVGLGLSLTFVVERIPAQLLNEADSLLDTHYAALRSDDSGETSRPDGSAVVVEIDGRDLTVTGHIEPDAPREVMVQELAGITGVRVVRDELRESDPAEQSRLEALAFQRELALLDARAVVFEPASTDLAGQATGVLYQLTELLVRYPATRIRIAGHTDNTGRANVNLRISRERARTVADYLAAVGIDPSRMVWQGYGDTQPIADNATASGRASNRRISFSYID